MGAAWAARSEPYGQSGFLGTPWQGFGMVG